MLDMHNKSDACEARSQGSAREVAVRAKVEGNLPL